MAALRRYIASIVLVVCALAAGCGNEVVQNLDMPAITFAFCDIRPSTIDLVTRMKLITFEKKLGLPGAVCVTIGAVIGVGIFVIVGPFGALARVWMQWLSLQRPYQHSTDYEPGQNIPWGKDPGD